MLTIDPRTTAVGAGSEGRGGVLIVAVVVAVLAAAGWVAAFELSSRADEEYACVEDERGVCPPVEMPAAAPFEELAAPAANGPAGDSANDPVHDPADDVVLVEERADAERASARASKPPAPAREASMLDSSPARVAGVSACLFQDARAARLAWERLPKADRPRLERLCRRLGVTLP